MGADTPDRLRETHLHEFLRDIGSSFRVDIGAGLLITRVLDGQSNIASGSRFEDKALPAS